MSERKIGAGHADDQGIVIYSVGQDRIDNSGMINARNPQAPGSDIGFRLWDLKHRRQPAPPFKTSVEE
jgi:hypothetical protein